VISYTKSDLDVYPIIWSIIAATFLSVVLSNIASGRELVFDPSEFLISEGRAGSLVLGSINEYPLLLCSCLCLLPPVYVQAKTWQKILLVLFAILFIRELLLTATRGGMIALLPLLGYLFYFKRKKVWINSLAIILLIIVIFADDFSLIIYSRASSEALENDFLRRGFRWTVALNDLWSWPYFLTGFGMRTIENYIPNTHSVHNGFLHLWVFSGLLGLLGFCLWLYHAIVLGIRKIKESHNQGNLTIFGLILSISCWIIIFSVTKGMYVGTGNPELYTFLTTQVALLVVLSHKQTHRRYGESISR
jgi:O-antigen ligase